MLIPPHATALHRLIVLLYYCIIYVHLSVVLLLSLVYVCMLPQHPNDALFWVEDVIPGDKNR